MSPRRKAHIAWLISVVAALSLTAVGVAAIRDADAVPAPCHPDVDGRPDCVDTKKQLTGAAPTAQGLALSSLDIR
ncbi:hypothetical protein, partial [Micromonospora sagamiensis]